MEAIVSFLSEKQHTYSVVVAETRAFTIFAGDSGISFQKLVRDGDDPEKFVVFGQKLRRRTLKLSDTVEGSVSCELPIRGRYKLERDGEELCNYPLLERAYAHSTFFTQAVCLA